MPVHQFDRVPEVSDLVGAVAVGDSNPYAVLFRDVQNDPAQAVLMHMDHLILRMLVKKPAKRFMVGNAERVQRRQMVELSPHLPDLLAVVPFIRAMRQEIKLDPRPVHVPIVVHQHGFQSAPVHVCNDL